MDKRLLRNHPNNKVQKAIEDQSKTTKALFRAMSIIMSKKQAEFQAHVNDSRSIKPVKNNGARL